MKPRLTDTCCLTRTVFTLSILAGLGAVAVAPASAQVGACCRPNDTCAPLTQADCTAAGGFYFGAGSGCAFVQCGVVGACCMPDQTCTFQPTEECTAAGGQFNGAGSKCATTNCATTGCGAGMCGVGAPMALLGVTAMWAIRGRRLTRRR